MAFITGPLMYPHNIRIKCKHSHFSQHQIPLDISIIKIRLTREN